MSLLSFKFSFNNSRKFVFSVSYPITLTFSSFIPEKSLVEKS